MEGKQEPLIDVVDVADRESDLRIFVSAAMTQPSKTGAVDNKQVFRGNRRAYPPVKLV